MQIVQNDIVGERLYIERLDSGLDVMIMPKKGFIKKYMIWATHYGSIDNKFVTPGEGNITSVPDGIAHFLEHKLFEQESGINALDELTMLGASANAYTSFNQTAYLFECTNNFEKSLEVLMRFVQNPYLTDENIEKEKGIISQEINMYNDVADWQVFFGFLRGLYKNHPIKKDIAGTIESIEKIDKELLYKCYNTFYSPSNMVMFLIGDFSVEEVLKEVKKNLLDKKDKGDIKRILEDEIEDINEKIVEKTLDINMPLFVVGYKDVAIKTKEPNLYDIYNNKEDLSHKINKSIAIEIIQELLVGKTSKLYNELYSENLIAGELATNYEFESSYAFSMMQGESKDPYKVIERINEEVEKFKNNGIREEDFSRIKNMYYGSYISNFDNVEKIASMFVSDYFRGINSFDYLKGYKDITIEFVEKVLKEHFVINKQVISIVKGK